MKVAQLAASSFGFTIDELLEKLQDMVMMQDISVSTSSEQVTLENVNGALGKNDAILGIAPVLRHRASHYCGQLDTHRGEIR